MRGEARLRREQGCLTDAVAYLFNVHPESVPFFVRPRKGWMSRLRAYFRKRGFEIEWKKSAAVPKRGTFIVVGDSLVWRTYSHCVVYRAGRLAYDPDYPSKWKSARVTHYLRVTPIAK